MKQIIIRHQRIAYKVGADSPSPRKYGAEELPAVMLIDTQNHRIVRRWTGKEVRVDEIARAIQDVVGRPAGTLPEADILVGEEIEEYWAGVDAANRSVEAITSGILAVEGSIGPDALEPLDQSYRSDLRQDSGADGVQDRLARAARTRVLGPEGGYAKLLASGRLTDEARDTVRDRLLEIAESDPSPSVRLWAPGMLRRSSGLVGDRVLLDRLRRMRETETNPLVRQSIDQAIRELDPATREEALSEPPHSGKLRRMLAQASDPASTPWAEAHAYSQTVPQRDTSQLIEDYRSFRGPTDLDDEVGRQNARLKRHMALVGLGTRIVQGQVDDLAGLKDILKEEFYGEPDPFNRVLMTDTLYGIGEAGAPALRADVVDFFEQGREKEADRFVRSRLEFYLQDWKGQ